MIIPAGYFIDLGYTIAWKRKGCRVKHPKRGSLEVAVVKGCPLIPKEIGLEILAEYEAKQGERSRVKSLGPMKPECELDPEAVRGWVKDRLTAAGDLGLTERDQLTVLGGLFPRTSTDVLGRACVPALTGPFGDYRELPWNRRKRRTLQRAEPGSVLLHVDDGKVGWRGLGVAVCVDGSEKGLDSQVVFQQLLRWAELGVFGGVVLGSWFNRELTSKDDLVLRIRALLLFVVAQAASDSRARSSSASLEVGRGVGVRPGSLEGSDPYQLALWALRETAARINGPPVSSSGGVPVFFVCDKLSCSGEKDGWDEEAWARIRRNWNLEEAVFDQACLGGSVAGPTTLLTSSWCLYEMLDARRVSEEVQLFLQGLGDLKKLWGQDKPLGWSSGLRRTVQGAWFRWKDECSHPDEIQHRRVLLSKLTEDEAYARHVVQDHVPYRKGCPVCISAQGRQRPHWRSAFPDMHSISVDISGPFVPGKSFNVEASGRDRGEGYCYMLAFAYAIPDKFKSEAVDELAEYEPSECGQLEPDAGGRATDSTLLGDNEELFPELFSLSGNGDEGEFGIKAVTHRVRRKGPEDAEVEGEQPSPETIPGPRERVGAHRTLFLGVPLRTKQGREVLPQIQGVINRLEAAGFPVHRYHSDRAKELRSAALIGWLKGQGIHPTWTAGESPAGNRAELAVQGLKGFMRKLLAVSGLDKIYWPLALQHASTRNWINFNEAVGIPQPALLPFGVKVHARRRTRSGFEAQWEPRTVEGTYLGHAPSTPGGHLVLIPDGEGFKVLLTNTIYPLRGAGDKVVKPRFKLKGKQSPPFEVRRAVAQQLSGCVPWSRCAPGGESSSKCFSQSDGFDDFEVPHRGFEVGCKEESFGKDGFVQGVSLLPEIPAGCGWFWEPEEAWVVSDERKGDNRWDSSCAARVCSVDPGTCAWIRGSLERQDYSDDTCLQVLQRGFESWPRRSRSFLSPGSGKAVLLGMWSCSTTFTALAKQGQVQFNAIRMYSLGGFHGISRATKG